MAEMMPEKRLSAENTIRWQLGYRWFVIRHQWACFWRDLPWRIALRLPRSVAMAAFIRVWGEACGETSGEFDTICDSWDARTNDHR